MDSFLKVFSPKEIISSKYYKIISETKPMILGPKPYLMDWTFIFEQIVLWKERNKRIATILDIGCGNSMFHTFLEKYYKHGIVGIDRIDSTIEYEKLETLGHIMVNSIDICCDFIEQGNQYFNESADIVFWNSSIEHNSFENIKKAVKTSMQALKKDGVFISTWAYGITTHWNENAIATILSELDAEKIFNLKWISKPNFGQIVNEYKDNILDLNDWHTKRFGHSNIDYVHAGSVIYKK